jgi:RHS repeat-associated protein
VTQFVFDASGRLLEEADSTGAAIREYIWLDNVPVAVVDDTGASPVIYYVHTDQLNRPQKMTDASASVVWDGVFDPFGNVTSVTGAATNLLMFPGQYYDSETQLSQNWFRDYDPTIGRYIQPDPIGLLGGINTYTYVDGNPLNWDDPLGFYSLHDFAYDAQTLLSGAGDSLSFGLSKWVRHELGRPDPDYCSKLYRIGEFIPFVAGGARLAYAGLAKGISLLPALTGVEASIARNELKSAFRLYLNRSYRAYTYEELSAKYGSDAAIKAAAGHTNPWLNGAAAAAVAGSTVNQAQ